MGEGTVEHRLQKERGSNGGGGVGKEGNGSGGNITNIMDI